MKMLMMYSTNGLKVLQVIIRAIYLFLEVSSHSLMF